MNGAQGIMKIIWFNQDSYGHFLLLLLFNSMDTQVDVELLDNDFQQANFYGHCSSNGTTNTYRLVVCDAWLCTFTHAYSIVMVEYIINLFLIYHSLKFRQSIFVCPKTALWTTGHKNPQLNP